MAADDDLVKALLEQAAQAQAVADEAGARAANLYARYVAAVCPVSVGDIVRILDSGARFVVTAITPRHQFNGQPPEPRVIGARLRKDGTFGKAGATVWRGVTVWQIEYPEMYTIETAGDGGKG